jgi:GTPase SAR1 family protein
MSAILPCIKVAVVGSTGCGKSSVIQRFCGKAFDERYAPTADVQVSDAVLEEGGAQVRGLFWEAGEAKDREAMHRFYEGALVVIVLYDVTQPLSFSQATEKYCRDAKR